MYAASQGHVEMTQALIDADADMNVEELNGKTALGWAVSQGYVEVIQTLVDAGADIKPRNLNGVIVL